MDAESTIVIRWDGPTQQVCYALTEFGYKAILEPGATYSVSEVVGKALLRSSRQWSPVSESGPAVRRTDGIFPGRIENSDGLSGSHDTDLAAA